jgi:hypothetical protein
MHSQICHEREPSALLEFGLAARPLDRFTESEWSAGKEVAAALVAQIPRIKISDPLFHLLFCNLPGIVNDGRQDARFVYIYIPELLGQGVVVPNLAPQLPQIIHRDTKRPLGPDAEARHPLSVMLTTEGVELRKNVG